MWKRNGVSRIRLVPAQFTFWRCTRTSSVARAEGQQRKMCCGSTAQLCSDFSILSHFQGILHGRSCPGLQSFMQSPKTSSQGLKPLPAISHGSAGYCAGLIIAFPSLSTPKEPINIGTNVGNVSELVISLFSVSRVAVGVVAGFDVACMQIKPHAWSRECLLVWWGEAYFFRYLWGGGGLDTEIFIFL